MSNNKRFLGVLAGFAVFAGSLLGMFQSSVSPDAEVHLAEDTVCVTDSYGVPVAPGEYAYFESYYSYYDSDCLPGDPVYYDADGDGVDEYDPSGDVTQDCGITDGYGSTVWPWGTASYEDYYETYDGDCTLTETYYYDTYGSSDSDGDSYSCEESSEYGLTCSECDSDSSYSYSCWDDSSSSSEYYCENSTEGSKECSTCYENDKETSSSCWINDYDSSGSYSSDGKTCEYYQDGNLFCSSCDDAKGNFENSNCWENSGDWTTEYYTEVRAGEERQCMKSYEDGVLENLSCWELTDATYDYEQPETDNDWEERYYSNATCVENNNGSSNGSWCEVCVDKSGDLVNTGSYNSCSDDVINDTLKDLGFDVEEEDDDDGDRDEDEDDEDYFCETASFFDEQSCVDAGCCEDKDYDDYEDDDFFDDNADYLTEEEWEELEDKRREDHEQWEEDRERYEEDLLEKSGDWIVEDVRMMRDEITDFEDGFSALKPYITDSLALRKINEVLDVVDSALDLLDDIEDKAGDFDDHNEIDEQFRKLDDLGRYVDPRIMFVIDHVKPNYDSFGFSSDDDEKISSVILEFDMHDDDFRDDECRHCDRFEEVSWNEDAQDLVQNLLDDKLDGLVNSLVQEISSASIDKL
ncbi:hypothetical protein HOK22_03195, partial [Candidatus Peregrinibacteria bacterium]|nr:hypothetical protein [Candidatus Peregrinibacteria bacterium]